MPDDKGESAHRFMGLSARAGLCVCIGRESGLRVGCPCSRAIREVGDASFTDELYESLENGFDGEKLSPLPPNFCNNDLSYA